MSHVSAETRAPVSARADALAPERMGRPRHATHPRIRTSPRDVHDGDSASRRCEHVGLRSTLEPRVPPPDVVGVGSRPRMDVRN